MKTFDERVYLNYVKGKLNDEPCFLDKKEFEYLEFLIDKILLKFLHDETVPNVHVAYYISDFIKRLKEKQLEFSATSLSLFCFWLGIFCQEETFSTFEQNTLYAMKIQCERFLQRICDNLPDESILEFSDDDFESMKLVRHASKSWSAKTRKKFSQNPGYGDVFGKFYDAWCNAYQEGMSTLGLSENVRALKSLMEATRNDENHEEFVITGEHHGNVHQNSPMQRGVTRTNGLKSSDPIYRKNENTLFQSHPSTSPLSWNCTRNIYEQRIKNGGDLGHITFLKKNMFVINRDGNIFYSNPKLAQLCLDEKERCRVWMGQVYLGNIDDF